MLQRRRRLCRVAEGAPPASLAPAGPGQWPGPAETGERTPDPNAEHNGDELPIDLLAAEFSDSRAMQAESSVAGTDCKLIVEAVPHAQDAAITVVKAGHFSTIASTSDVPNQSTAFSTKPVRGHVWTRSSSTRCSAPEISARKAAGRTSPAAPWPRWCSMLSMRLFLQQDTLGALNLYAGDRDAFSDHDRAIGTAFAAHAAIALQAAHDHEQLQNLRTALDSSRRIGAALGILMCRHNLTERQAFDLMVKANQHSNRKLRLVADDVLYTGSLSG